jgi:hypothetical protein
MKEGRRRKDDAGRKEGRKERMMADRKEGKDGREGGRNVPTKIM